MNRRTLEIKSPVAECGACGFRSALEGKWSVEDGRLVWRGAAELQSGRGPDIFHCIEGRNCGDFDNVTVDDELLSAEQLHALRETEWPGYREERGRA